MTIKQKLWQFACAAMVLIAVQFAPALARAHGGHDHGAAPHSDHNHHSIASHEIASHGVTAAQNTPFVAGVEAPAKSETIITAQDAASSAKDVDGCASGCCCKGIGCCGAAALASPSQSLPLASRWHRLDLAGPIRVLGTEPESLRKPPRNLA